MLASKYVADRICVELNRVQASPLSGGFGRCTRSPKTEAPNIAWLRRVLIAKIGLACSHPVLVKMHLAWKSGTGCRYSQMKQRAKKNQIGTKDGIEHLKCSPISVEQMKSEAVTGPIQASDLTITTVGNEPAHSQPDAKAETFGHVADLYFSRGSSSAMAELEKSHRHWLLPWSVTDPETAQEVFRTDTVTEQDQIAYSDYSPPPLWEPPYSILRARFAKERQDSLIFHPGEELLVPIGDGEINYQFWTYEGTPCKPKLVEKGPFRAGQICRINPATPHHTWGATASAEAFMFFRDLVGTPIAIKHARLRLRGERAADDSHRTSIEELRNNPARFWMTATKVAEKVRLFRTASDLQIQDLAELCELDRGFLSRLEEGKVNLSFHNLVRVAQSLGFDPFETLRDDFWFCESASLIGNPDQEGRLNLIEPLSSRQNPSKNRHFLHVRQLELSAGHRKSLIEPQPLPLGTMASWIALKGEIKFTLHLAAANGRPMDVVRFLNNGSVLHLREPCNCDIRAIEPSKLLELRHSTLTPPASS